MFNYSAENTASIFAARSIMLFNMDNDKAIEEACHDGDIYLDQQTMDHMRSLVAYQLYELEGTIV